MVRAARSRWRCLPLAVVTASGLLLGVGVDPALAAPGDRLWAATETPASFGPGFVAGVVAGDGTLVAVGGTGSAGSEYGSDWLIVAYAPDGTRLWRYRLTKPGLPGGTGLAAAVAVRGDLVYVAGTLNAGLGQGRDITLAGFDLGTGQREWLNRYDGPGGGYDNAYDVAVDPGTGVAYVVGGSDADSYDYFTMAVGADGTRLWQRRDGSPEGLDDEARAVGLDAAGNVYVTGQSSRFTTGAGFSRTLSYTPTGQLRWRIRTNAPGSQVLLFDLAVDPVAQRVYVAGWQQAGVDPSRTATIAYDLAGTQQWWQDTANGNERRTTSVAVDPGNGQVYTASTTGTAPTYDAAITAYAADGTGLWGRNVGVTGEADFAAAVAVDPVTHTVFLGRTLLSGPTSALLAFASDGTPRWARLQTTSGAERSYADTIAVDPARGQVYVGGRAETGPDFEGRTLLTAYAVS